MSVAEPLDKAAPGDVDIEAQSGDEATTRFNPLRSQALWAVLGAVLLVAIYGRSVLPHLGEGVIGGNGDGFENLWNNWWVKTARHTGSPHPRSSTLGSTARCFIRALK